MADLAITASAVLAGTNARTEQGVAGETITAGKLVYRDATTGKYMMSDSNAASASARVVRGMALNGASDGQPLQIARPGCDITMNAVLTAGVTYYLSDTPGGICPLADVGTGEYFQPIGVAKSTTQLAFNPTLSGVPG
ncbi:hypothetical protein [Bradyrhizobium sp. BRP23]|uniref:hypothetical protein n=1 Tax=Bradyrhizobium sp. BRP23 TaxID=2793820 RepID=UPI001CD462A3|nr:hypothetical protein [Bradyrhizobium sp. BRP23]MCA1381299.1 hypothetical protein [Bradyrhizobium sp. BRP05]MCA1418581.1 hypothetical protein [Bradyrhizobium sp. BRP23]